MIVFTGHRLTTDLLLNIYYGQNPCNQVLLGLTSIHRNTETDGIPETAFSYSLELKTSKSIRIVCEIKNKVVKL
jgi:hypothetical protein